MEPPFDEFLNVFLVPSLLIKIECLIVFHSNVGVMSAREADGELDTF